MSVHVHHTPGEPSAANPLLDPSTLFANFDAGYDYASYCNWEDAYAATVVREAEHSERHCSTNIEQTRALVERAMREQCTSLRRAEAKVAGFKNLLKNLAIALKSRNIDYDRLRAEFTESQRQREQLERRIKDLESRINGIQNEHKAQGDQMTIVTQKYDTLVKVHERVVQHWRNVYKALWDKVYHVLEEKALEVVEVSIATATTTTTHVETSFSTATTVV